MSCYLPIEVVERILLRLPPNPLVTCKRVCKSWHALITSPSFVKKHLRIATENNKHSPSVNLLLAWTEFASSDGNPVSKLEMLLISIGTEDDGSNDNDTIPCVIENIPISIIKGLGLPSHLSSYHCDGILCLCYLYPSSVLEFVLCNISLKEFKTFRAPPYFTPKCKKAAACGFGYDSRADVYKYVQSFCDPCGRRLSTVMVYTLGTEAWREIEIDLQYDFDFIFDSWVYHDGVYYWLGLSDSKFFVLTFRMSEEVFDIILFPDFFTIPRPLSRLALWNERIVLLWPVYDGSGMSVRSYEMWVMVENFRDGEGFTWTKHGVVKPPEHYRIHLAIAFWKDDELLMETVDGKIVSYNISTQKLRQLMTLGALALGMRSAHVYLPSLVSVKTRNANNL